jgi:hypothetical protein
VVLQDTQVIDFVRVFLIYFLDEIRDNGCMVSQNKNAAQRQRADLINIVTLLKPAAVAAGFDYPTADPKTATTHELKELIEDVTFFIQSYANGEV